ncbi:hypothetical protein QUF80_19090 [Desulfococcaceae bacterium HSG8]|nr:hypothetical protein [Desulfococcaceae bacterium HSG8]
MKESAIYIDDLSSEEKELLDMGKKIRDAGHDPVKVLGYYMEAQGTFKKAVDLGKQAHEFFFKQWEELEKGFKEKVDKEKEK